METRFKTRITRLFRGSLASCRTRNTPDVIENSVFLPQQEKDLNFNDPLPIKARPFPSICRHKCPESTAELFSNSIFPRRKISNRYVPLIASANTSSRRSHCHSATSPVFPLNPFYKKTGSKERKKNHSSNSKRSTRTKKKKNPNTIFSSSSQDSAYFGGSYYWFSSDIDEEIEAVKNRANDESDTLFFSSRSLSSDSSGSFRRHHRKMQSLGGRKIAPGFAGNPRKQSSSKKQSSTAISSDKVGAVFPILEDGKVKDSFAVVKSSSDPYNDFRTSMLEMIVEKQIFGAKDLEHLLRCFLSLNSNHHHKIIVEVFTEICETLFSNWH